MSERPPTAEQRAAIEARAADVLLEAGAGTGKTTVLVDRYCSAVIEDGVEVERILAFTFTDRAAAEMRSRVRTELSARAAAAQRGGDAQAADELKAASRATERAWVLTIHAFCRRLLARHPLAAGLDPRFRVLDAAESDRLRDRAVTEALDELLASGDEGVARAVAAYQAWRITAMAVSAHERLRSQGIADPRLPPVSDPLHSPRRDEEQRDLTPDELRAAAEARAALERLLEAFHRRYERLKEERSALDFLDLELRTLALLRGSPEVAVAWSGRFDHVMVDEFQDTNRVQLELVEALRGPETRLFVVGDEQQSIYRFRNADLSVFRGERARALADPETEVLPLRGNFRSLPDVLAGINEVGGALLEGFAELAAERSADATGEIELLLTLDEGTGQNARKWAAEEIELDPPPTGSSAKVVAEARGLAERLRELVDGGAARGDIVVLLRAFTHVDTYEEALRRFGLRPFVVGGRGYWTQQQVEDLIRLLGVVANPLDDEYLFGALASFAVGVGPEALWLLRRASSDEEGRPRHVWPLVAWGYGDEGEPPRACQPEWLEHVDARDRERLRRFCRVLAPLRAEAPLLTLEELVERTMTAFGYDLGLLARAGGAGRMANVRKLMRLAREYERNEGRDLAGFLRLAVESTRRDEREGMAAVEAEGHDGVRVMTVHAAKGLEFPIVAAPDLGRALNAGHRGGDVVVGRLEDSGEPRFGMRLAFAAGESVGLWELTALTAEESEAEAEEGCRLVYVAASRARDRLILSGVYKPTELEPCENPKPSNPPLRRLLPALVARGWQGGEGAVSLPGPPLVAGDGAGRRAPDAELRIRISEPTPERAQELRRTLRAPPEPDPLAEASRTPPLLDERPRPVPVGGLSYSSLALYERCGYRFYTERVLGMHEPQLAVAGVEGADADGDELAEPSLDRAGALALGNAVHAALEWSGKRRWERPSDEELASLLAREGIAAESEAAARARRLVDAWLGSALCAELAGAELRTEVPFVLDLDGTVVRGQIDLLARRPGEPPTVIDFKTDALDGRSPAELAHRYRAQREVYALAVGGEVGARAVHVFLERPDEPVVAELDAAGLGEARRRLDAVIARMHDGEFEPAADPYPALCFGCPAAARLCPRPAWHPRAAPAAGARRAAEEPPTNGSYVQLELT